MPETNNDAIDYALGLFHLLASEPRLNILRELHLAEESLRASDLAQRIDATQPATTYHLNILHEEGLVRVEARGCERLYSLSKLTIHRRLQVLFPHLFPEPGCRALPWSL